MKIDKKKLITFIKKVHMNEIDECLFEFSEEGLNIKATTPAKMSFVSATLKAEAFEDYVSFGPVALNDIRNLLSVIDRFGKDIELTKEGNIITIKGDKKTVDIECMAAQFLEEQQQVPNIEPTEVFTITSTQLTDIFKDVKMNKDAELIIETKKDAVQFSNTGKYKFKTAFEIEGIAEEVRVKFGLPLIEALSNLTESLEFGVRTDYPAVVKEKTEESEVTIIVAPRVENKE